MNEEFLPNFSEYNEIEKKSFYISWEDEGKKENQDDKDTKRNEEYLIYSKNIVEKIIIPYNFKSNNFSLSYKEIERFKGKEYLLNTLYDLNMKEIFKLDSPYSPTIIDSILINFLILVILIIILYILLLFNIFPLFNPIMIYCSYKIVARTYKIMSKIRKTINEKYKKKAMKKILSEKSNSKYCQDHKVKWELGLSFYWLELKKFQ